MSYQYLLGKWRIQPDDNQVVDTATDQVFVLEPKTMDVLTLLIEHNGQVVSRETFQHEVWSGRIVVDEGLTRCISELRRVLGDNATHPTYIKTIPKRGYKLICDVEMFEEKRSHPSLSLPEDTDTSSQSAPFQPFTLQNLSIFLSIIAAIVVIATRLDGWNSVETNREQTAQPKEDMAQIFSELTQSGYSARTLNWVDTKNQRHYRVFAEYIKQQDGRWVKLTLVDANNREIWEHLRQDNNSTERYIATTEFVRGLALIQTSRTDPSVINLPKPLQNKYQQALYRMHKRSENDLNQALVLFDEVLNERPDFIEALVNKAATTKSLVAYTANVEQKKHLFEMFDLLLQQAKQQSPNHPQVLALTTKLDVQSPDWLAHEQILVDAVEKYPACMACVRTLAEFYVIAGFYTKAINVTESHLPYFPLSSLAHGHLAELYSRLGDADKTLQQTKIIDALGGANSFGSIGMRMNVYAMTGNKEKYLEYVKRLVDSYPSLSYQLDARKAILEQDHQKLRAAVANLNRIDFNLSIAAGEFDKVISRLQSNVARGNLRDIGLTHGWLYSKNQIHRYYPDNSIKLKNHPEVIAVFEQIGLLGYWQTLGQWPDYCDKENRPVFCPS